MTMIELRKPMPVALRADAVYRDAEHDAQDSAREDRHGDHEALLLRCEAERFADLHAQRPEHRPYHEADVEVEECGEECRPVAGFFQVGYFHVMWLLDC